MNEKGFTLAETIAAVAILGILFMTAIPGISNATEKNKRNTYVNDANRMLAAARSIYKKDTTINEPTTTTCVIFTLKDLGLNDLNSGPYKGEYLEKYSYVTINHRTVSNTEYFYYGVQLVEGVPKTEIKDNKRQKVRDASGNVVYKFYRGIKYIQGEERYTTSSLNPYQLQQSLNITLKASDIQNNLDGFTIISNNNLQGSYARCGNVSSRITP